MADAWSIFAAMSVSRSSGTSTWMWSVSFVPELCDDSARANIEVVKALEDASEGAGISVGDYSKSK